MQKTRPPREESYRYAEVFQNVIDAFDISEDKAALFISVNPRTLYRKLSRASTFNHLEIDRIKMLQEVVREGKDVFGNIDDFQQWLDFKAPALGYKTPLELLNHSKGISQVLDLLAAIKYGLPS